MNPSDLLYSTVSGILPFIIIDIQTAMVGLLTIGLVVMGLRWLIAVLSSVDPEDVEKEDQEKGL